MLHLSYFEEDKHWDISLEFQIDGSDLRADASTEHFTPRTGENIKARDIKYERQTQSEIGW